MTRSSLTLVPIALLTLLAACGGDSTAGATSDAQPGCLRGEAAVCGCTDGRAGSQLCAEDGLGYGKCVCTGPLPSSVTSGGSSATGTQATGGATSSTGATASGGGGSAAVGAGGLGGASTSSSSSHASSSHSSSGVTNGPSTTSSASAGGGGAGGANAGGGGDSATSSSGAGGSPLGGPWGRAYGSVGSATISSLASDSHGNVVVAGLFGHTMTLGGHTYTCAGTTNGPSCAWLAKVDNTGNLVWSRIVQVDGSSASNSVPGIQVAVGPEDEVVFAGIFLNLVDYGFGFVSAAGYAVFAATFESDGTPRWGAHYDRVGQNSGMTLCGLAVDPTGRVGVAVQGQPVDFGVGQTGFGQQTQLAVLEPNGVLAWERTFATETMLTASNGLAATQLGDWTLVAPFTVDVDLGCGVVSAQNASAFVASFDGSGQCRRSRALGRTQGTLIALDPNDEATIVAGGLAGPLDAGSSTLTPVGPDDAFVVRLDDNLDPIWGRRFGGMQQDSAGALAVDAQTGDIALGGVFQGTIDLGGGPLSEPGNMFVARFTSGGAPLFSAHYGDSHGGSVQGLAFDAAGDLFAGGTFGGTMDFQNGVVIQAASSQDAYLAKLVP